MKGRFVTGAALALSSLCLSVSGCSGPMGCDDSIQPGVQIYLRDKITEERICNATVRLTSTHGVEDVRAMPLTCDYMGAHEQPGHYEISIAAPGYLPLNLETTVRPGGCHVQTVRLELRLDPQ